MSRLPPFDPLGAGRHTPATPAIPATPDEQNSRNSKNSRAGPRQRAKAGFPESEVSEEQLTTSQTPVDPAVEDNPEAELQVERLTESMEVAQVQVDLPFPAGYGGLPKAQVEAAEIVNDKFGISDPVHRRYNVVSWVRGHSQDRGENHGEHYEALKREQQRLGSILDRRARNR